MTLPASCCKKK